MRPNSRLLFLVGGWTLLGLLASAWPVLQPAWTGAGILLLLTAVADFATLPRSGSLHAERSLPGRFGLGVRGHVTLRITHTLSRPLPVRLHDGLPAWSHTTDLPWTGALAPGLPTQLTYELHFTRRGLHSFQPAHLLTSSRLGLWERLHRIGGNSETRCYPNYEPVVRFALLATANRVEQMGIIRKRRAGAALDFHQLRDYQDGDVLSRIDWKSTARRQTLISRDYEDQKNQTILLVPDCGRRMRAMDGELTQFDHCLNAMVLMGFIALRQGDELGVVGFGGVHRWLKPIRGQAAMPKLLNHLYDYQTSNEPSDFLDAAERIMALQKRRALIIFLTNLRTEDSSHLLKAARLLQQRHLPLIATLREAEMEERATAPVHTLDDALRFSSLCSYFQERQQLLENLRAHRILTIDETAQRLPIALANRYLDLKAGGIL